MCISSSASAVLLGLSSALGAAGGAGLCRTRRLRGGYVPPASSTAAGGPGLCRARRLREGRVCAALDGCGGVGMCRAAVQVRLSRPKVAQGCSLAAHLIAMCHGLLGKKKPKKDAALAAAAAVVVLKGCW